MVTKGVSSRPGGGFVLPNGLEIDIDAFATKRDDRSVCPTCRGRRGKAKR